MHCLKIGSNRPGLINNSYVPHDVDHWQQIETGLYKCFHWSKFNNNLCDIKIQGDRLLDLHHFLASTDIALTATLVSSKGINGYISLSCSQSLNQS